MNREFVTFTALIVILLALLALLVVVPEFRIRDRVDEEVRVFRALQEIAVAEHRFRIGSDPERFGFLVDLLEGPDGGVPWLDLHPDGRPDADAVRLGAYRIAVFLPGGDGRPVPVSGRARVDAERAAHAFLAFAAPADPASGLHPYVVDQTLLVYEYRGEERLGGERLTPPVEEMVRKDPETGKLIVLGLPEVWTVALGKAQKRWLRARFAALDVPVPRGLAAEEPR